MIDSRDITPFQMAEAIAHRALLRELLRRLPKDQIEKMLDEAREEEAAFPDREATPDERALAEPALRAQRRILEQALIRHTPQR